MTKTREDQPNHERSDETPKFGAQEASRPSNAAAGASTAGLRTITSQAVAFYFRAPAKAFFRTRIDYMALARVLQPTDQPTERWSLRLTTPGLLLHATRSHGWRFIPDFVLPPLLANIGVGAAMYTTYLHTLGLLHPPSAEPCKRVHPPPGLGATLTAGATAGAVQSVLAAPLDALAVQFRTSDVLERRYRSMWSFAFGKLRTMRIGTVFAGWPLNMARDCLASAVFFATFEWVKAQACLLSLKAWYSRSTADTVRPHVLIEPFFLLLAGVSASVVQQVVVYPMNRIQRPGEGRIPLFQGFCRHTLTQVPSTSAGLIIFEIVRRCYGQPDETRVSMGNVVLLLP